MIKLAALGALGYAGYKYFQKNANQSGRGTAGKQNAVAGGPLSNKAHLQPVANSSTN